MTIDELAARVANVRPTRRGGLVGRCPVHDDSTNSLSIDVGADDRVLLHCFAGCATEDVAAALGLGLRDLFVEEAAPAVDFGNGNGRVKPITTRHQIRRRDGTLVAVHVRQEPGWDGSHKSLWWEAPDGSKRLTVPANRLPLYGAQDLDGWDAGGLVVVTEGEKACDVLRAAGVHAVATVTGAAIRPADEVLADLAGRHILCWPDADDAGRYHLGMVAQRLAGAAATVRTLTPPDGVAKGWDAADAVAEGIDPWDLIDAVPPGVTTEDAPPDEGETEPSVVPIVAELGARRLSEIPMPDSVPMLIDRLDPAGHTILYGSGGVGKGVVASWWIVQLVQAGQVVLILDYEAHEGEWRRRVESLGGTDVLDAVYYVAPLTPSWGGKRGAIWAQADALAELAAAVGATYLVIDSIVPACGAVDPTKPEAASQYAAALMRIGLPALSLAHVPKADATPLYPFGSAFWHNLARMTWSLARAGGEDHEVVLAHRKHNAYAGVGKVLVTISWDDDGPAEVIEKPYAMALGDRIAEVLEDGPATVAAIVETLNDDAGEDGTRVKADTVRHALSRGLRAGRFRLDGQKWGLSA